MAQALRLYTEATLDTMISVEDSFGEPDAVASLDGGAGDEDETALWVAVEQGVLAEDMTDSQEYIVLSEARFADWDTLPLLVCGTEKMLITADGGTTTVAVSRGYHGTTAAAHTAADRVYLGYDTTDNSIDCRDNEQVLTSDESGWITYADDVAGVAGSYEAPHALDNLAYDESQKIWRKVVVPAETPPARKTDLIHDIDHEVSEATL